MGSRAKQVSGISLDMTRQRRDLNNVVSLIIISSWRQSGQGKFGTETFWATLGQMNMF